jgi:hypothetical protein
MPLYNTIFNMPKQIFPKEIVLLIHVSITHIKAPSLDFQHFYLQCIASIYPSLLVISHECKGR